MILGGCTTYFQRRTSIKMADLSVNKLEYRLDYYMGKVV